MAIRLYRNSLEFPAGVAPGFDPTHPAAGTFVKLSFVARGTNLFNVLNGIPATQLGSPSTYIDGIAGPAMRVTTGDNKGAQFTGLTTGNFTAAVTCAFIFVLKSAVDSTNARAVVGDTFSVYTWTTNDIRLWTGTNGFAATNTNGVVVQNQPMFLVWTYYGGKYHFHWRNLITGVTGSDFNHSFGTAPGADSSTINSIVTFSGNTGTDISAFAGMESNAALSPAQMTAWAADPWSFWYPNAKQGGNVLDHWNDEAPIVITTRGRGSVQTVESNPLEYPAGCTPGFDPTHLAAASISAGYGLSAIALGGSLVDVFTGIAGTLNGTPLAAIDSRLGNAVNMSTTTSTASFSGKVAQTDTGVTFALILKFGTVGAFQGLIADSSSAGGWGIELANSAEFSLVTPGHNDLRSGLVPVAGVPYFAVASGNNSAQNFLLRRLDTGVVLTASTSAATTSNATNGTYVVGAYGNSTGGCKPIIAACAIIPNRFLTVTLMQVWASDPWSFWYPRNSQAQLAQGGILPQLRQSHFRFRTDGNAVDAAPTWGALEDLGQ